MAKVTKQTVFSPWLVWSCVAVLYFYQFVLRSSPGVIGDCLIHEFHINGCALGIFASSYYNAYMVMQIPVGVMLDRYGVRNMLSLSCFIAALGALIFSISDNLAMASFGRLLTGAGSACCFIGSVKLINQIFPKKKVAYMVGLTMLAGTLGGAMAGGPLGFLLDVLAWRYMITIFAVIGFVLTAIIYKYTNIKHKNAHKEDNVVESVKVIATNPQVWFLGIFGCLMYMPLAVLSDLWGTPFISTLYGIEKKYAAMIISSIYLGVCFGAPIVAYIASRLHRYKIVMLVSAITSLLAYSAVIYIPMQSQLTAAGMLFIGGFMFGGQCLVFTLITHIVPAKRTGIALGVMNTIIMLSGSISEPIVGSLLDMSAGSNNFQVADYQYALIIVPIGILVSIISLKFIKGK